MVEIGQHCPRTNALRVEPSTEEELGNSELSRLLLEHFISLCPFFRTENTLPAPITLGQPELGREATLILCQKLLGPSGTGRSGSGPLTGTHIAAVVNAVSVYRKTDAWIPFQKAAGKLKSAKT